MTAFNPVDLRVVQATQPYLVYHRYALNTPRVYSMYEVPYGYNYLVREVFCRWDGAGTLTTDPALSTEVFNASSARARQTGPVPIMLYSSPGGENAVVPAAGGVPPFGVQFFAVPLTSYRLVNIAFPYGDTVRLEITGQIPGYSFVDIVLHGYLIAESAISLWGNERRRGVKRGDN